MLDKVKAVGNKVLNKKVSLKDVLIWTGVGVAGGVVVYTVVTNDHLTDSVMEMAESIGTSVEEVEAVVDEVTESIEGNV